MSHTEPETAYELGRQYETSYRGCAQCVLAALQDVFDLQDDVLFQAASGFAGGGGLCGDSACGAYAGSIMMLSRLCGRPRTDFADQAGVLFQNFRLVQMLHQHFIDEYGSVICRDIHTRIFGRPYYLADPDDLEKFDQAGGHYDKCPEVVGKAARWAAEIIISEGLI